jgi:hypothetical protein
MGAEALALGALTGTSLFSANQQKKAAKRAARAQMSAAEQSAELQREALQQSRLASEPFRFGGQQAINPLLQSLGIAPIQTPTQPAFSMLTGEPTDFETQIDRRAEIEKRIAELKQMQES